ncbi:hypothetical protein NQZ68_022741 [Dissostichus eleginoides]|nr:hypothetical protein NQZ68_022741 [Dissostichus eleginoides]
MQGEEGGEDSTTEGPACSSTRRTSAHTLQETVGRMMEAPCPGFITGWEKLIPRLDVSPEAARRCPASCLCPNQTANSFQSHWR